RFLHPAHPHQARHPRRCATHHDGARNRLPMGLTNLRGRMIAFAAIGTTALVAVVAILPQLLAASASEADARAIGHARADGITAGVRVVHGRLRVLEGTDDFLGATAWVFDASGHLVEGTVPASARSSVRRLVME